ncbi:MAG: glycoside hydrolase family 108 protein [Rhizobiales bacterium]|nr:glycoside hydrolase family 108 protein [Hyphomicrobiales bacterium]
MAAENFDAALKHVLRHEGGYADHPSDPGGATMMGITRATLAEWRRRAVSKDEVRALSRQEAGEIYRARYWNVVSGDALPAGLDLVLFDHAVNSGPGRAVRTLQGLLAVEIDGRMGPRTLAALEGQELPSLIRDMCQARRNFLRNLPTAPVFGRGWMRRVDAIERASLKMAGEGMIETAPKFQEKETSMNLTKNILESRTVWANTIGLASIALSIFGFKTGEIEPNLIADKALEAVAAVSFIASTLFRVLATKKLA